MQRRTGRVVAALVAAATLFAGGGAAYAASASLNDLQQTLDSTKPELVKPSASGGHNDSDTAPYDSYKLNEKDLAKLNSARAEAEQLISSKSTDANKIGKAKEALESAFKDARIVYHYTGITGTNGARMYDNNGNYIQAHGAGFVKTKTSILAKEDQALDANGDGYVYIWLGEDKVDRLVAHGVHIYFSDDLMNWVDKGRGFETYMGDKDLQDRLNGSDPIYQKYYNVANMKQDPDYTNIYGKDFKAFKDDWSNNNIDNPEKALDMLLWDLKALKGDGSDPNNPSAVFERPKMAYNEKTGRWVIWFHADGPKYKDESKATYSKAKAGVAISVGSDPAGPYKYLGSFRMSPGTNDNGDPGMARDMNLWIDDKDANNDGVNDAYLIYSSNHNADLTISLLDDTYTKLVVPNEQQKRGTDVAAGDTYNIVATDSRESPAPFKWNGKYHIIFSHTTGWAPNENEYITSAGDNILGPYEHHSTPFIDGDGYEQHHGNSYWTQSSSVIPVDEEKGKFIYWGDRWFNPDSGWDISDSRYVMAPIEMVGDEVKIHPYADWTLDELNKFQVVNIVTKLPTETGSMSDFMKTLPDTIEVSQGKGAPFSTHVTWDHYYGADQPAGNVTISGTVDNPKGGRVYHTVAVYPKNTVLYIDAGSKKDNESAYYQGLRKNAPNLMNKEVSDQPYSDGGWGYVSKVGEDIKLYDTETSDVYETGWWAEKGKAINYKADLPAGKYTVTAGVHDWWAQYNDRTVHFVAIDGKGNELGSKDVYSKWSNASEPITFTLDKDQTVTFSAQRSNKNNLDPILSWINVSKSDENAVESVQSVDELQVVQEGKKAQLPAEVTVTLSNGKSEQRKVDWDPIPASATPFAPAEVKGAVEGTTIPAKATVITAPKNLEYFIDSNGEDSAVYHAIDKATGNKLANRKGDQKDDGTWGNASKNFGTNGDASNDPYSYGIYGGADKTNTPLAYRLTLEPGKHQLQVGMSDWWWQTRPTKMVYQIGDGSDTDGHIDGGRFDQQTINVTHSNTVNTATIEIKGDKPQSVLIHMSSTEGSGPVMSWISATKVIKDEPEQPEEKLTLELKKQGTGGSEVTINSAEQGEKLTLSARGFTPGHKVKFELHSNPVLLSPDGGVEVDANGVATLKDAVIPKDTDTKVEHHIVVTDLANDKLTASAPLKVTEKKAEPVDPDQPTDPKDPEDPKTDPKDPDQPTDPKGEDCKDDSGKTDPKDDKDNSGKTDDSKSDDSKSDSKSDNDKSDSKSTKAQEQSDEKYGPLASTGSAIAIVAVVAVALAALGCALVLVRRA